MGKEFEMEDLYQTFGIGYGVEVTSGDSDDEQSYADWN